MGSANRNLHITLAIFLGCFLLVLYAPFVIMTILSFQPLEGGPQFPMMGFDVVWYRQLFGGLTEAELASTNAQPLPLADTLPRSLLIAVLTMVIATALGVMTAHAFRQRFRLAGAMFYLVLMGMVVPGILVGLGTRLMLVRLDLPPSIITTLGMHVLYTYPFTFLVMLAYFNRFDATVEEASMSLGVPPGKTFRLVTLPLIFPGVLSAMLFAFTLSYDEFPRSNMVTTPATQTLPPAIYGTFGTQINPNLFAFGVLTTLFSFAVLAIYVIAMLRVSARRARAMAIQEDVG